MKPTSDKINRKLKLNARQTILFAAFPIIATLLTQIASFIPVLGFVTAVLSIQLSYILAIVGIVLAFTNVTTIIRSHRRDELVPSHIQKLVFTSCILIMLCAGSLGIPATIYEVQRISKVNASSERFQQEQEIIQNQGPNWQRQWKDISVDEYSTYMKTCSSVSRVFLGIDPYWRNKKITNSQYDVNTSQSKTGLMMAQNPDDTTKVDLWVGQANKADVYDVSRTAFTRHLCQRDTFIGFYSGFITP